MAAGLGLTWNSGNCRYLMSGPWGHCHTHITALSSSTLDIPLPQSPCPGTIFRLWPHQQPCSCCSLAVKTLKKYQVFFLLNHDFRMPRAIRSLTPPRDYVSPGLYWHISIESKRRMLYLTQARVWLVIAGLVQSTYFFRSYINEELHSSDQRFKIS